jgi:peptidase M28-like protein/PA domain-containing protein
MPKAKAKTVGKRGGHPLFDQVKVDRMISDVNALAQWDRLSGTPEELQAFRYVQRQLKGAGVKTTLLIHDAFISLPGPAGLHVTPAGKMATPLRCVTHSFSAVTSPDGFEADATYLADASAADFTAATVAGKIAVVDGLANPARVYAGEAAGAVGMVFLNRDRLVHEMIVSTVWGSPPPEHLNRVPHIPVVSVAQPEGDRIREFLSKPGGAKIKLTTQVDTGWRKTPLLIGELRGSVEDSFVLISGHVDSWHKGAMDNGTANATMLEVARIMAKQKRYRGVRFAFWSGHSHGRYSGSTWYADNHWDELNANCVVHVNVDSTGGMGSVINRHAFSMPETRGVADRVIRTVEGSGGFEGGRIGRMGDQSFVGVGIPSLLMDVSEQPGDSPHASRDFNLPTGGSTGGLGWWWHTTDDLPDKIDPAALARDAKVYLGIVHAFATEPVVPLDYNAVAQAWVERLRGIPRNANRFVNLRPTLGEAQRLARSTSALLRRAASMRKARPDVVRAFNAGLLALSRHLIPVDYTQTGRFDHDLAMESREPPRLAAVKALGAAKGDAIKHLTVRAVRDLNALRFALAAAADTADAAASGRNTMKRGSRGR